jgi:hypothetical protein
MSVPVRRPAALGIFGLAAMLAAPAWAQAPAAERSAEDLAAAAVEALETNSVTSTEEPEEVTIRGRRTVTEYRLEMERARDDIVKIFNELNDDSDQEVVCRNERPTGSRMPVRVCRSVAESRAEARAAKDFLNALTMNAGGFRSLTGATEGTQANANSGTAAAQTGMVMQGAAARATLEKELLRLMSESRPLYRAVLKYVEVSDEYKTARAGAAE